MQSLYKNVVVVVLLLSYSSLAFSKGPITFDTALEVNQSVESFFNSFAKVYFTSFESIDIKLKSENGHVVNEFDSGTLQGEMTGLAGQNKTSSVNFQFGMHLSFTPGKEVGKKAEYEINFTSVGEISNTADFINGIDCSSGKSYICPLFKNFNESDFQTSVLKSLTTWKQDFLNQISEEEDLKYQQLPKIRERFINYLDENIQITQSGDEIRFEAAMSDLASEFRKEAGLWLNDREYIDHSLYNLSIVISPEITRVEVHYVKRHRVNSFKDYMAILASYQDSFEDPKFGRNMARSLSEDPGALKSAIKKNGHSSDSVNAFFLKRKIDKRNEQSAKEATKTEEDLGLD